MYLYLRLLVLRLPQLLGDAAGCGSWRRSCARTCWRRRHHFIVLRIRSGPVQQKSQLAELVVDKTRSGSDAKANGEMRTLYCDPSRRAACSWPSFAMSSSPCALHWAAASLLANTVSRFACPADRSSVVLLAIQRWACPHRCQMLGIWHPGACPSWTCLRPTVPPWRPLLLQSPWVCSRGGALFGGRQ